MTPVNQTVFKSSILCVQLLNTLIILAPMQCYASLLTFFNTTFESFWPKQCKTKNLSDSVWAVNLMHGASDVLDFYYSMFCQINKGPLQPEVSEDLVLNV